MLRGSPWENGYIESFNAGQGHGEDLVRKAIDFAQRLNQARSHSGQPVSATRIIACLQLPVDPADQIAIGNVANEQIQRIGGLVEAAIPQIVLWQRTAPNVIGLGTGAADLVVSAIMEMPVLLSWGNSHHHQGPG
jgi:hypothetical protein